jgi:hypothetical protein
MLLLKFKVKQIMNITFLVVSFNEILMYLTVKINIKKVLTITSDLSSIFNGEPIVLLRYSTLKPVQPTVTP